MSKKFFSLFLASLVICCSASFCYANQKRAFFDVASDFANIAPSDKSNPLGGFYNPAILGFVDSNITSVFWSAANRDNEDYKNWAIFSASPNFGLAYVNETFQGHEIYDARISMAESRENFSFGTGFGWSNGDSYFFNHHKSFWIFGMLYKAHPTIDIGGTILIQDYSNYKEEGYYFVFKPLSNETLRLAYEHNYQSWSLWSQLRESYSISVRPWKYLDLQARYYSDENYTIGVFVNFSGQISAIYNSFFSKKYGYENSIYGIKLNYKDEELYA